MTVAEIEQFISRQAAIECGGPSVVHTRFLAEIALQFAVFNERAAAQFAFDQERAAMDEENRRRNAELDEEDREQDEDRRARALEQMEQLISVQGRLVGQLVPPIPPGRPAIVVPMPDSVPSTGPSDPAAAVADSSTAANAGRQTEEESPLRDLAQRAIRRQEMEDGCK